jgi:hypothetical protein
MKTKMAVLAAILILFTGGVFAQEGTWSPFLNFRYTVGLNYNDVTGGEYIYGFNSGTNVGVRYASESFDALVRAQLESPSIKYAWVTWKPTDVVSLKAGLEESPFYYASGLAYMGDNNGDLGAVGTSTVLQVKLSAYGAYIVLWDPNTSHVPLSSGFNNIKDISQFDDPAFALGYDWANDMFRIGGGVAGTPVPQSTDISFIIYLHGKVTLGKLYIALNAAFEKAPAPFKLKSLDTSKAYGNNVVGDLTKDNLLEGYVEAGYGTPIGKLAGTVGFLQGIADESGTILQVGASLAIPLNDYVSVVPGIIYRNLLVDVGNNENYNIKGGVTFNVNF